MRGKRIRGWMMFDWASQPYATLILTFVFGPYFAETVAAKFVAGGMQASQAAAQAQACWGYGITIAGIAIAVLAPILGAVADSSGRRMPWIWLFSAAYVIGAFGLWWSSPENFGVMQVLFFLVLGLLGMEFATTFVNALLPSLGGRAMLGRISGNGWALGYLGGVLALAIMLGLLAENAAGVTLSGGAPILGLDPALREGTRAVGPLTAIWYVVFMIPFAAWVREASPTTARRVSVAQGLADLAATLRHLPARRSLLDWLASSMFCRDALNGIYVFGGIHALGVLGWGVVDTGLFGIVAAIAGALFAWLGGRADSAYGPKPVIAICILVLIATGLVIVTLTRESVLGIPLAGESRLPDMLFLVCGGAIGAAGAVLQAASRTMMVRQANPGRMTEAFGLYALAGKATAFLAPAAVAITSDLTGSQSLGMTPLIGLLVLGFVFLIRVRPDGEERGTTCGGS